MRSILPCGVQLHLHNNDLVTQGKENLQCAKYPRYQLRYVTNLEAFSTIVVYRVHKALYPKHAQATHKSTQGTLSKEQTLCNCPRHWDGFLHQYLGTVKIFFGQSALCGSVLPLPPFLPPLPPFLPPSLPPFLPPFSPRLFCYRKSINFSAKYNTTLEYNHCL